MADVLVPSSPLLRGSSDALDPRLAKGDADSSSDSMQAREEGQTQDSELYTPVQSSVRSLSARVRTSATVLSALSRLESLVPASVASQARAQAQRVQGLTLAYGQPLAQRVDERLDGAIRALLAAPTTAGAHVAAADHFAYERTPDLLKPTYDSGRKLAIKAAHVAVDKVQQVRRTGLSELERLRGGLDGLSRSLRDLSAGLSATAVDASRPAIQAAQQRLAELQNKISSTVSAAGGSVRARNAQLRAVSAEVVAGVAELSGSMVAYVEDHLSEEHAAALRTLWMRMLDTVHTLKDTLTISGRSSAASTRSNSDASSAASPPGAGVVASAVAAIEAAEAAHAESNPLASSSADEHADADDASEGETSPQPQQQHAAEEEIKRNGVANGSRKAKHAANKRKNKKQAQRESEEKQKEAADSMP